MSHAKRKRLSKEDFDSALKWSGLEVCCKPHYKNACTMQIARCMHSCILSVSTANSLTLYHSHCMGSALSLLRSCTFTRMGFTLWRTRRCCCRSSPCPPPSPPPASPLPPHSAVSPPPSPPTASPLTQRSVLPRPPQQPPPSPLTQQSAPIYNIIWP